MEMPQIESNDQVQSDSNKKMNLYHFRTRTSFNSS